MLALARRNRSVRVAAVSLALRVLRFTRQQVTAFGVLKVLGLFIVGLGSCLGFL